MMTRTHPTRGFTLLIAIIITAVILSVALALLDISYKQVILASSARQSVYAFYAADSALECALYWDSRGTFDYASEPTSGGPFRCENANINFSAPAVSVGESRTTTFTIPCPSGAGDPIAEVTIYKSSTGSTNIYANGYNSCNAADPRRVQRGLKAKY